MRPREGRTPNLWDPMERSKAGGAEGHRLKLVEIGHRDPIDPFDLIQSGPDDGVVAIVEHPMIPPGARYSAGPANGEAWGPRVLVVEHRSFDPVPDGTPPPRLPGLARIRVERLAPRSMTGVVSGGGDLDQARQIVGRIRSLYDPEYAGNGSQEALVPLEGGRLRELADRGGLPPEVRSQVTEVARALAHRPWSESCPTVFLELGRLEARIAAAQEPPKP